MTTHVLDQGVGNLVLLRHRGSICLTLHFGTRLAFSSLQMAVFSPFPPSSLCMSASEYPFLTGTQVTLDWPHPPPTTVLTWLPLFPNKVTSAGPGGQSLSKGSWVPCGLGKHPSLCFPLQLVYLWAHHQLQLLAL